MSDVERLLSPGALHGSCLPCLDGCGLHHGDDRACDGTGQPARGGGWAGAAALLDGLAVLSRCGKKPDGRNDRRSALLEPVEQGRDRFGRCRRIVRLYGERAGDRQLRTRGRRFANAHYRHAERLTVRLAATFVGTACLGISGPGSSYNNWVGWFWINLIQSIYNS